MDRSRRSVFCLSVQVQVGASGGKEVRRFDLTGEYAGVFLLVILVILG